MREAVLLFTSAFLLCTGCREARQSASSHAADIQALRDVEVAEEQSWISKDLDKAVSFIADDAVVMNPNTAALRGKDQIRASMKQGFFDDPTSAITYQITAIEVAQSGELGYTSGTYAFTSSDPITKKPVTDHGNWLTVRKKQPDGSWKIVRDMSNSDLPLPNPGK